jgi:hypothetical protein
MSMRQKARRAVSSLAAATLVAGTMATSAFAVDMSSKADIEAAVSGKTYQGSMLDNGFAEYYDPDGSIRASGYSGSWRVDEGVMCFTYGDSPERCWDVLVDGPAMTMYRDDEINGNGILVDGNPHDF